MLALATALKVILGGDKLNAPTVCLWGTHFDQTTQLPRPSWEKVFNVFLKSLFYDLNRHRRCESSSNNPEPNITWLGDLISHTTDKVLSEGKVVYISFL